MLSAFEDMNISAVPGKLGNPEIKADEFDEPLEIGVAWIAALTFAWIATVLVSMVSAWAYLYE